MAKGSDSVKHQPYFENYLKPNLKMKLLISSIR